MIASPNQKSAEELELPELLELLGDTVKGKIVPPCPACGARGGAFQLGRRSKKADWEWNCKICGAGGGCLSYLMARGSITYAEAIHRYKVLSELQGPLWVPAEYTKVSQPTSGRSSAKQTDSSHPNKKVITDL